VAFTAFFKEKDIIKSAGEAKESTKLTKFCKNPNHRLFVHFAHNQILLQKLTERDKIKFYFAN
jgi:hypothetical protein